MKRTGLARIRTPDRQAAHPAALRRGGAGGECAVPADLGDNDERPPERAATPLAMR